MYITGSFLASQIVYFYIVMIIVSILVGCPLQEADFSGLNENHAKQHEVLFSRLKRGELSSFVSAGNCSYTSNTKHINILMKCVINPRISRRSWTYKMCYWPTVFTTLRLVTAKA